MSIRVAALPFEDGGEMDAPSPDDFWESVMKDVTDIGCWMWSGGIVKRVKYSRVRMPDGRVLAPYEYAWELTKGRHDGKLHEVCPCQGCVNPDHWTDEISEIVEDDPALYKPPRRGRRQSHCKRGHPLEGANLIHTGGKRKCRACIRLGNAIEVAQRAKTERKPKPDREALIRELETESARALARRYGVTEGAVRRWKRGYGL